MNLLLLLFKKESTRVLRARPKKELNNVVFYLCACVLCVNIYCVCVYILNAQKEKNNSTETKFFIRFEATPTETFSVMKLQFFLMKEGKTQTSQIPTRSLSSETEVRRSDIENERYAHTVLLRAHNTRARVE